MIIILPILLATTSLDALPAIGSPIDIIAATTLSFVPSPEEHSEKVASTVKIPTVSSAWGREGSWRWGLQGGYAEDIKNSSNEIVSLGIDFEFFVEDYLSLDMGIHFLDIDQVGISTTGVNATLLLRWHFLTRDTWSMFVEGGAGLLRTSDSVPVLGSRFNFTPQAGLGFSFDAGNQNRWLIGVKWHHISNANIYSSNPGRDSIMVWTGISFPF